MSKIFSSGTLNYRQTKTICLFLFVMDYEVSHVIEKDRCSVNFFDSDWHSPQNEPLASNHRRESLLIEQHPFLSQLSLTLEKGLATNWSN